MAYQCTILSISHVLYLIFSFPLLSLCQPLLFCLLICLHLTIKLSIPFICQSLFICMFFLIIVSHKCIFLTSFNRQHNSKSKADTVQPSGNCGLCHLCPSHYQRYDVHYYGFCFSIPDCTSGKNSWSATSSGDWGMVILYLSVYFSETLSKFQLNS